MKTVLCGSTKEVIIDTNGLVIIIGESINLAKRKNQYRPYRKEIMSLLGVSQKPARRYR